MEASVAGLPFPFLAVAHAMEKISRKQAVEIDRERKKYLERWCIDPPPVGEIGIQLSILTADSMSQILQQQQRYRSGDETPGKPLSDPLVDNQVVEPRQKKVTAKARTIFGLFALGLVAIMWYWKGWEAAQVRLEFCLALWVTVELVWPRLPYGEIRLHRLPYFLKYLLPFVLLHILYALALFGDIARGITKAVMPEAIVGLQIVIASHVLVLLSYIGYYFVLARWRHREIWIHEDRSDMVRLLVQRTYDVISQRTKDNQLSLAEQLMETAALCMKLSHPWGWLLDQVLSKISKTPHTLAITLFYLEPNLNGKFSVKALVSPGADSEIQKPLGIIKREYQPIQLNEDKYKLARKNCTGTDGTFDRDKFRCYDRKNEFVSLTGFVYGRRQHFDGATRDCLVFDHDYRQIIRIASRTPAVQNWLNFEGALAYPVFRASRQESHPIGVLLAVKNVPEVTAEDRNIIVMTSQLLGSRP